MANTVLSKIVLFSFSVALSSCCYMCPKSFEFSPTVSPSGETSYPAKISFDECQDPATCLAIKRLNKDQEIIVGLVEDGKITPEQFVVLQKEYISAVKLLTSQADEVEKQETAPTEADPPAPTPTPTIRTFSNERALMADSPPFIPSLTKEGLGAEMSKLATQFTRKVSAYNN